MSITIALSTARKGTVFLSIVCFAISYIALADLAHIAGLGPEAYLWPVMVDGTIIIGTVAVVAQPDRHSWSLLIAGAVVSIGGNAVHAWYTQGSWIAVAVALTPPIFLLWTTHVTVELGRRADTSEIETTASQPDREDPPDTSHKELSMDEKRARALELITEGHITSMREIARRVGTDDRNVRRWRDSTRTEPKSLVGVST